MLRLNYYLDSVTNKIYHSERHKYNYKIHLKQTAHDSPRVNPSDLTNVVRRLTRGGESKTSSAADAPTVNTAPHGPPKIEIATARGNNNRDRKYGNLHRR